MKKRIPIKRFRAFWLLFLFTISITPKIYLHDAIANHKDGVTLCDHPQKTGVCIHQKGYNCDVNDPVVANPYLILPIVNGLSIERVFLDFSTSYSFACIQNCFIHKESRGPPTV